jgi:hypothetical protein
MEMIPKLTLLTEQHRGLIFELTEARYRVGRSPEAELTVNDGTISGFHCEIVVDDEGGYWVIDEGMSTNGTRINGEIATNQVLKNADILQMGSVECMYECDDDAASLDTGTDHRIEIEEDTLVANTKTRNLAPGAFQESGKSLGKGMKIGIWCLVVVAVGLIALLIRALMAPSGP